MQKEHGAIPTLSQCSANGSYSNHDKKEGHQANLGWGEGTLWEGTEAQCDRQKPFTQPSPTPSCQGLHISQCRETASLFIKNPPIKGTGTLHLQHGLWHSLAARLQQGLIHCPAQPPQVPPAPQLHTQSCPLWAWLRRPPNAWPPLLPWLSVITDLLFPNVKSLNEVTSTGGARGGSQVFPKSRRP